MGVLEQFDPTKRAMIEPGSFMYRDAILDPTDFLSIPDTFPKVAVSTFSGRVFDKMVSTRRAEEVAASATANGRVSLYQITHDDVDVALYLSPVGAPASACLMEELIAMGVEKFLFFGACGVLTKDLPPGLLVVPDAAVRDEGTSYHYAPPGDEISLDPGVVARVAGVLEQRGVPHVVGKTWTTDAIYRETKNRVEARQKQGCIVVDMECSALAAVAQFRGVTFGQFLFTEDNLDADEWQPRTLGEQGAALGDKYISAALACALAL